MCVRVCVHVRLHVRVCVRVRVRVRTIRNAAMIQDRFPARTASSACKCMSVIRASIAFDILAMGFAWL